MTLSTETNAPGSAGSGTAEDVQPIAQLVLWERQARVRRLGGELASCFWPDATVTTSWMSGSVQDYLHAGDARARRAEAGTDELITNRSSAPNIHVRGERAYAELPVETNHWIRVHGEEAVWTSLMRLVYRCEKRGGIWKISDMTSLFEADKLAPAVPGTDLRVNPADVRGFRRSYRWLAYVRLQAGGTVSQDLPGTDRETDVERVYGAARAWLDGARTESAEG